MSGHTKGPWVSETSVDECGLSVIASLEPGFISNPSRGQVCHISVIAGASGVGIDDQIDVARANGRLIAAAPDLLEALEGFLAASDALDEAAMPEEYAAARAAIDKARATEAQP